MKPLLAATALLVALVVAAVSGGVLSATGEEPGRRMGQVRVAETDDETSLGGNPAAQEFVAAKKAWTSCVSETATAHDPEAGRSDPAQACGTKPHPHDFSGKHGKKRGAPPWSAGAGRGRTR